MTDKRTHIKFRFIRPVAINLPSFPEEGLMLGNYYPHYEQYEKRVGDVDVPLGVYDLSKEVELVLLNELPEPLPPYLADQADDEIRNAYKIDQVKVATKNNAICEQIRRYLEHYERQGHIQITFDSFKTDGGQPVPVAKKRSPGRRAPRKKTNT